ncbi:hypothetical protein NKR23_g877 [Pleurostoma richardsiae]|uniref:Uncharacterized protein n=1 Tax=Pleurostoma richardsiae TaxID=41990 RepID=A0AA38VZQ5_9PEZI|nr:hypothetical protein NKR23_g877 [Pleurostoma richardsiae]
MSARKAPSEGTKVNLGQNAPTYQESAGTVPDESLAAESYRAGGEFASNRGAEPTSSAPQSSGVEVGSGGGGGGRQQHHAGSGNSSYRAPAAGATGTRTGALAAGASSAEGEAQGGAAPSYVSSQFAREKGGPHGKNLKEVDSFEPGSRPGNSLGAEPGSKWDPARVAEQQMALNQAGGSGPRQGGIEGEQPYGALDRDTSA